jgi:MtfA peptidase
MLRRYKAWREAQALQGALKRRPISDALWQQTLQRYPFLTWRSAADLSALRTLTARFLDDKEFTGVDGFRITDDVALAVAAQACLPILHLGLARYRNFVGIVMHADEVVAQREVMDDDGLVHRYQEVLAGEAMEGGPITLSWADVSDAAAVAHAGYNVVIHEFAHVLDMENGAADGMPLMPSMDAARAWHAVMQAEYDHFSERVVCGHDTVVDPYGAEGIDEFFAVASESFFVQPLALNDERPALYRVLATYFKQDPAAMACL